MLDFPFETTLIILLGLVSLGLAVLVFLFLVFNRLRRTAKRAKFEQVKHISVPQHVARFTTTIIWILLSFALLFLAAFVQSFQNFTREELVGEVRCRQLEDEPEAMLFELTQITKGRRQETRGFVLSGDQWALEGDILKWDNWMNFFGLHTMYKFTRVRGRYLDIEQERNSSSSVFGLAEEQNDPKWRWLYRYGYRLRFVDAVYGNTVFTYPDDKQVFQVFVTTSGFSVKVKEGGL